MGDLPSLPDGTGPASIAAAITAAGAALVAVLRVPVSMRGLRSEIRSLRTEFEEHLREERKMRGTLTRLEQWRVDHASRESEQREEDRRTRQEIKDDVRSLRESFDSLAQAVYKMMGNHHP